jgi:hypothetical protein
MAVAVGDGDRASAHEQARAWNGAGRDGIAQLEGGAVAAAEVAQRGDPGKQGVARVDRASQPHGHVAVALDVFEWHRTRTEGHVHVGIHETGNDGVTGIVQALGSRKTRRQLRDVADRGDALPLHRNLHRSGLRPPPCHRSASRRT